MDNDEIGRCDDSIWGSQPGFGISEILALYKVGGRPEVSIVWLNMRKSRGDNLEPNFLKNSTLKASWPGALLLGKAKITWVISSKLIFYLADQPSPTIIWVNPNSQKMYQKLESLGCPVTGRH